MLFSINVRPDSGVESWTHNFDGHVLRSTLRYDPLRDLVLVRFGPGICGAVVRRKGRELVVDVADMWVLGVPLPKALIPRSASREWQDDDKGFCFDISLPYRRVDCWYVMKDVLHWRRDFDVI